MDRATLLDAIHSLANRAADVATEPAPGRPDRTEYLERFAILASQLFAFADGAKPIHHSPAVNALRKHVRYLAEQQATAAETAVYDWLDGLPLADDDAI